MMSAPARRMRRQRLEHRARLVDPAVARRGLQHRVLTAHVVRRRRIAERVLHLADDVEVGHRRLHHDEVGAFVDVLLDLAQRLAALAGSIWCDRRSPNCGVDSAASRNGP